MNEHISFGVSLLRDLAVKHPTDILIRKDGVALRGPRMIQYLDSLPPYRKFISGCPKALPDGSCGCAS